jgi:hypothetical protein
MELEKIKQKIAILSKTRAEERLNMFQVICDKSEHGGEDAVKNFLNEMGGSIQKTAEELERGALNGCQEIVTAPDGEEGSL